MGNRSVYLFFFMGLIGLVVLSLFVGHVSLLMISPAEARDLVLELRLPRTLLALFTGFSLGVGGVVLQSYFKNPLVDANILGISSLGSLGGMIAVALGVHLVYPYGTTLCSMIFSGLGFLFLMGFIHKGWQDQRLILIGLSLSVFAGAVGTLVLNLVANPYAFFEIFFWLFGSFSEASLLQLLLLSPFIVFGLFLFFKMGPDLDKLSFGDDVAMSLGVNLKTLGIKLCMATVLSVGIAVSLAGNVGFVGLVVPPMMRPFWGERPSTLLLPSGIGGAMLTLVADIIVRILPTTMELKAGVVLALLSAPILVFILGRKDPHVTCEKP